MVAAAMAAIRQASFHPEAAANIARSAISLPQMAALFRMPLGRAAQAARRITGMAATAAIPPSTHHRLSPKAARVEQALAGLVLVAQAAPGLLRTSMVALVVRLARTLPALAAAVPVAPVALAQQAARAIRRLTKPVAAVVVLLAAALQAMALPVIHQLAVRAARIKPQAKLAVLAAHPLP